MSYCSVTLTGLVLSSSSIVYAVVLAVVFLEWNYFAYTLLADKTFVLFSVYTSVHIAPTRRQNKTTVRTTEKDDSKNDRTRLQ